MFWHNFKYTFKTLLKNKMLLFWTFAFPLILGTFFHMAFSNIESSETLKVFDIAVVESDEFTSNEFFKESLSKLGDPDSENQLFDIDYISLEAAKEKLSEGDITGYIYFEEGPHVVVSTSGINETVLLSAVDEISEYEIIVNNLVKDALEKGNSQVDIARVVEEFTSSLEEKVDVIEDESNENMSYTMIEYYTLIAMSCLYGGTISMVVISNLLANASSKGKRVSIAPIKKSTSILSGLLASYIVQLFGILLLFLFTIFILDVDYGNNLPLIVLLSILGSLAGLSMGVLIGTMTKLNDNAKTGTLIAITMFWCFLSGMMGITMKYIIDTNVKVVNLINPANMITDGLYSLYYYSSLDRYYFNIASLIVFSLVLVLFSINSLRRKKYDSI